MDYLHNFNPKILHRDLKSLNLMLLHKVTHPDAEVIIKLSDFGFARAQDKAMTEGVGTMHWMAPEVMKGTEYSEKADIFSYAMVAFETVCRHIPFEKLRPQAVLMKIGAGERPSFDDMSPGTPEVLLQLISNCWAQDPEQRPPFCQIMEVVASIPPSEETS